MAYITARELRAVVPDQYRDAALSDQGGEPDPGLLSAVIDQACEEVDALIEGRVRLPLSTPFPQKIRTAAVYFALEILFTRRALEMPDATAKKIAGIRSDLGKVGAGDLRLEASVEQTAASRQAGGSIVVRPSITGAGGMIGAIVLLLSGLAHPAKAIEPRTFSFEIRSTNLIENADYLEWSQAESVKMSYTLLPPNVDDGRDVRWEITDKSNLWINAAPSSRLRSTWIWTLSPTQSCLPAGRYAGRVAVYERTGTNLIFHRAVALQEVRVASAADPLTLVLASPLGTLTEYSFDASMASLSNSLAFRIGREETNRDAAVVAVQANLNSASNSLSERIGTVQANLNTASNLAEQANARAIAAHAAVSNLPPIPSADWFVPTNRTIAINGRTQSLAGNIEFEVDGGTSGNWSTSAAQSDVDVNGYNLNSIGTMEVEGVSGIPDFFGGLNLVPFAGAPVRSRVAYSNFIGRCSSNTLFDSGTNALFKNSGGGRYFINNPDAPGDLLFSDDGRELDFNDGDIDGVSDLQVSTISPRPGFDAPDFTHGLKICGVLGTSWPESSSSTVLYYNVTADSCAVGNQAIARTNGSAFGTAAWADTYGAAFGDTAYAPKSGAALGADTIATDRGVAVGRGAIAEHTNVAVGASAQATGHNSVSIGAFTINDMDNTVMLGNAATTQTVARGTLVVDSIALGTCEPTSVWPQGVTGGTTNIFTGAGTTGLVASASGDTNKFLRGDGTWQEVQAGTAGGITSLVVNGYAVPQTNGQAYLSITTSGGIFSSNTPGNVELFLSSFPAWAGVGSNRVSFVYVTNAPQFFTVPAGVTNMAFWIWGAGAYNAGLGGSSFATAPVTPGESLDIRVAGRGASQTKTNDFVSGGWPGGGDGYSKGAALTQSGAGYSGVFRGTNVVVIAAGGGSGASGGGISGATGTGTPGVGGSQTAGGSAASTNQLAGSYLQGGHATTNATGVGGGGGYFGGGGGIATGASGGGSGFINTSLGVIGYTFRGQVGTELAEYISGKGGSLQDGLIVLGY